MRVAFLVDGFNLYHSICDAITDGAPSDLKWLNVRSLCSSFLSIFNDKDAHLVDVYYFSSFANYKGAATVQRHGVYKRALEAIGVKSVLGEFKEKEVKCEANCRLKYKVHVEKQTDVNIALKLLELFQSNQCDACVLVSGDGDLLRAITTAKALFPEKKVAIMFPYGRWHQEMSKYADYRVRLQIQHYKDHLLDNPLETAPGKVTRMPKEWMSSAEVRK